MKKRLLAAIMSLCMIFSLLPVSALAAPGEDMEDRSGGSQDAYFYILKPDEAQDAERVPENFIYMGRGQINGAPPAGDRYGDVIDKSDNEWNEWECVSPNNMPNVDYEGETYVYWDRSTSPSEPESSYYTVTWFRYASAYGANDAEVAGMCWHVDGFVTLSNKVNVQFQVKFPTENDFTVVGSNGEAGDEDNYWYVDKDSTFGKISDKPRMEDRTEGETTYEFDGWYTYDDFNTKVTENTKITKDTIFYGRYVEKGPDLTVTKELTKVVRDGAELTGALSDDTTLYAGDVVTWEITVANHTDSIISNLAIRENFKVGNVEIGQFPDEPDGYTLSAVTAPTDNLSAFSVESKQSKTFKVSYTIKSYDDGNTLSNTVTVQNSEVTASASTKNDIGYTIKVTYNGNGGTLTDKSETKTVTARVESTSNNYTVEDDSFGFSYSGHTFAGWYTQQGGSGENVTGDTVSIASIATYFAKWAEDKEPVNPETDIFFFIAQPTSQILSDNENDYRYLTHGGVIDTEKAVEAGIDANGITDTNNETTITQYVQTWPESGALGDTTDVGFNVASKPVGTDSTWKIDEDGNVTSFSLDIDGTIYTNDQYEIRWVKISHATTANREDPDINNSVRYHVDGMLYEKTTVENILSKINITKTVEDNLWPYNDNGDQMTGAEFDIYLDRANDTGNQFTDIKIGKVTPNNGQYDFIVEAGLTSKYLTPGEYVIKEVLTETQEYMWEYGFTLNSDGSVAVGGNVVAEGQKEAFAFTNTAKTFPLTYDKGTAPEGTSVPTDTQEYTYNQEATVSSERPTWSGHTFKGWSDGTNTYQPGDTIRITTDTTLTAVWDTLPRYTLTYNPSGGTGAPGPDTNLLAGLHPLNDSTVPTYGSNIFMGWTTDGSAVDEVYGVGQQLPTIATEVTIPNTTTVYAVWSQDTDGDKVPDVNEVFIAPADITIYTGGTGYEGVSDGDGNEIQNSNSGLPEPGFHITLPADLNMGFGEYLDEKVRFTYQGSDDLAGGVEVTREWTLSYVGIYSDTPRQYVYSLESADGTPPIRVTYRDPVSGAVLEDADIGMTEDAAHGTYTMSINSGGLTPSAIQAVITTADGTPATRNLVIGTCELIIRSTVDDDTTPIAGNEDEVSGGSFTAVDNGASYKVNDSEVDVPTTGDRVHLLVDEVSDSPDFNNAMGEAALDHPQVNGTAFETVYLDLVDSQNGNTVVTLDSGSMDIYWPMPSNADPYGDFQVVHYVDMNREVSTTEDQLDNQRTELLDGTAERINGDWYVHFTTHSFSPFVLVYEEDTSRPVNPNPGGGSGGGDDHDPTGNLSIELDVNGGDDEFTFTVILTDKDGDDLENNFYYNGDYTGTIGSGDEITLEGGDKIVIRNLPEGTRYEVIIETADGYTYVIDGEEGVIHTGMNEAEFTATRTVPVADPSVTGVSRWLNTTDHIAYLTGYPGGAFGPDNNMTRAEVAQMFYALLNNKNVTITKTFPDVPADAWYATAVNTLASLGMVSGDENGNYRPNDPITRAEFCVIALAFAYEPENAVCYFGDVSRSDWFYTYVAQAASYGWIGGYTNGNFGPNDRITRAQVTTIVNNMLGRAADRDYVIDHQADLVQFTDLTRAHWGYFQIMEATNAHEYTKSNGTENWR